MKSIGSAANETEATVNMPLVALSCRGAGHRWPRFDAHVREAVRLMTRGERSMVIEDVCEAGCGVTRKLEYSVPLMDVVGGPTFKYPKDENGNDTYLLPKELRGTGRLTRGEVRYAQVARVAQEIKAERRRQRAASSPAVEAVGIAS